MRNSENSEFSVSYFCQPVGLHNTVSFISDFFFVIIIISVYQGYCVYNEGYRKEGDWALNITSVITFGRIHLVEDEEVALKICSELTRKFTDDQAYLEQEIKNSFRNVQCLELIPEHMTGKLVNES